MTALALALLVGGLHFVQQDLPFVQLGPLDPLAAQHAANFLQQDLNGDGAVDLLTGQQVALQRGGGFPEEQRHALPDVPERAGVDAWRGRVYLREEARLRVLRWGEAGWNVELDQAVAWPDERTLKKERVVGGATQPPTKLDRFVHDLDGDGVAELVVATASGLWVSRWDGAAYGEGTLLAVLPEKQLYPERAQALWPVEARRLHAPERRLVCEILLDPGALMVMSTLPGPGAETRYRVARWATADILPGAAGLGDAAVQTLVMPKFAQPCRLNDDGRIDFAGGRWEYSNARVLPMPVYELVVSVDGGQTISRRRAVRMSRHLPAQALTDWDRDGDLDLVMESVSLGRAGPREAVHQFTSKRSLDLTYAVFLQEGGGFASAPSAEFELRLKLERPPFRESPQLTRYWRGESVNLRGDLDGDGWADVVLRESGEALSVYRGRAGSVEPKPAATVPVAENETLRVYDMNADGRDDIVLPSRLGRGDTTTRVWFSREDAP